jgi:hypothetical protein
MLKEGFQAERTLEVFLDLGDLAMGQFFPTRADGGAFAEAVEEKLDLTESEVHLAGEADEQHAIESVCGVAALATNALGGSEETHFFVVADGGGVEAGALGKFSDFHTSLPSPGSFRTLAKRYVAAEAGKQQLYCRTPQETRREWGLT